MSEKLYIITSTDLLSVRAIHISDIAIQLLFATTLSLVTDECRAMDVMFLTGTDEHSLKIEQKAAEKGVTPKNMLTK